MAHLGRTDFIRLPVAILGSPVVLLLSRPEHNPLNRLPDPDNRVFMHHVLLASCPVLHPGGASLQELPRPDTVPPFKYIQEAEGY